MEAPALRTRLPQAPSKYMDGVVLFVRGDFMATIASSGRASRGREHRFFLISAIVMAVLNVAAFSLANLLGRSSFAAPPIVHAHALVFFGWVTIYLVQNILAASGSLALHRRLGWIAAGWMVAMVVLGILVTVRMVRLGHVPFFFTPVYFLIMNPVGVLTFAGLSSWAIVLRRRTEWHKRLHLCGMAMIMGPALGRLLPVPLFMPHVGAILFAVMLLFPLSGVWADHRRSGRIHPAWWFGIACMVVAQAAIDLLAATAPGLWFHDLVTTGSAGARVAPLAYPPFPPL